MKKSNRLNNHHIALSAALASIVFYALCAAAMLCWPTHTPHYFAAMYLLDSFGPLTEYFYMDGTTFVKGILQIGIYSYVYVYLFCFFYNSIPSFKK